MSQKKFLLHILLFVVTFFSTFLAGAMQAGVNVLKEPEKIYKGFPFALTLMSILLAHELSHYFASRKHRVNATLPYFIPAPTIIGTFGAFIKMKSPITTRQALMDIGVSGPIAGFIISIVVSIIGLSLSQVVPIQKAEGSLNLGDSLLFSTLSQLILDYQPGVQDVLLHPVAFAGWIGFFVTSLNLIPVGQLDGGHVAYALFGGKIHKKTSFIIVVILLFMGVTKIVVSGDIFYGMLNSHIDILNYAEKYFWAGWAFWAIILMLILGLRHPPILYSEGPLDGKRRFLGWLAFLILILTFIPVPFKI
jgi:membrane-associated protease RseP (regulator of RpoE activity)